MKDQHPLIKGYRGLSQFEIDLKTNSTKTLADAMKKMSERSYKEESEDIMQHQIYVMQHHLK